jgi:hypothetical protein
MSDYADKKDIKGIQFSYTNSRSESFVEVVTFKNLMIRNDAREMFLDLYKQSNVRFVKLLTTDGNIVHICG